MVAVDLLRTIKTTRDQIALWVTDTPHRLLHTERTRRKQVCRRDTDRNITQVPRDSGTKTMPALGNVEPDMNINERA